MIPKAVVPKPVSSISEIILSSFLENTDAQTFFHYILIQEGKDETHASMWKKDQTTVVVDREGKARSWNCLSDFGPDSERCEEPMEYFKQRSGGMSIVLL